MNHQRDLSNNDWSDDEELGPACNDYESWLDGGVRDSLRVEGGGSSSGGGGSNSDSVDGEDSRVVRKERWKGQEWMIDWVN